MTVVAFNTSCDDLNKKVDKNLILILNQNITDEPA